MDWHWASNSWFPLLDQGHFSWAEFIQIIDRLPKALTAPAAPLSSLLFLLPTLQQHVSHKPAEPRSRKRSGSRTGSGNVAPPGTWQESFALAAASASEPDLMGPQVLSRVWSFSRFSLSLSGTADGVEGQCAHYMPSATDRNWSGL